MPCAASFIILVSVANRAQYISGCKRTTRLANIRRLRPDSCQYSQTIVRGRGYRCRLEKYGVRTGFNYHRFMPFAFSLGTFSKTQSRSQNAYADRYPWFNTCFYTDHRRKSPRCKHSRYSSNRTWCILSDRPRVYRFFADVWHNLQQCIFRNIDKVESTISTGLFPSIRYFQRSAFRSDNPTDRHSIQQRLPRQIAPYSLLRCRPETAPVFLDEQPHPSSSYHCKAIQKSLEGRNFLQMDQTASSDKSLLWTIGERRQITNLDCDKCISAHCHSQKKLNLEMSLYTILQVISVSIFEKMPILQAFQDIDINELNSSPCIQLNLFDL